tara:strand:+ start:746 stop:898 length:153 start_codon:yes stop_codon:yes gene_type:complete
MKAIKITKNKVTYKVGKLEFQAKILREEDDFYVVKHVSKGERSLNRRVYK